MKEKIDKFKVFKLHKCEEELQGNIVQLDGVSFSYTGETKDILFKNVNLTVEFGDKIAIIGNNGTGKVKKNKK